MIILGIMSGSSLDGIDYAVVDIEQHSFELLLTQAIDLTSKLKKDIQSSATLSIEAYKRHEVTYTQYIAGHILHIIDLCPEVELISIHGHTVLHQPDVGYSLQMVNGGLLAALVNRDVISDVRSQAIGKGGQGAPLAPIIDQLFPEYDTFINLGGISNISQKTQHRSSIGFDMGPCNQLTNFFVKKEGLSYDENGAMGRSGMVIDEILEKWQSDTYYSLQPPKSIANEWVKSKYLYDRAYQEYSTPDLCATAYAFISWTIVKAIELLPHQPEKILVTGGGAYNQFLIEKLTSELSPQTLVDIPDAPIIEYKECILMAYLGYLYHNNYCASSLLSSEQIETVPLGCLHKSNYKRCR